MRRILIQLLMVMLVVSVGGCRKRYSTEDEPIEKSFDGSSEVLEATAVVPTLETPMPTGKNAIWCLSFQLAWNRLKEDVVKEPIKLAKAEDVVERLNEAEAGEDDILSESYYATAGYVDEGIVERIKEEMAAKFPEEEVELGPEEWEEIVAYAYMQARVKFEVPFDVFADNDPLIFEGKEVHSFGFWRYDPDMEEMKEQVEVLYQTIPADVYRYREPCEFALDLCRDSRPYQLILAKLPRKVTLGEMVEDLQGKIADFTQNEMWRNVGGNDVLQVPEMFWKVTHHFGELEGVDKVFLNEGFRDLFISRAMQVIEFRMDRSGVFVDSGAQVFAEKALPRDFILDEPFLVMIRKRGGDRPLLVMWVENAELLRRKDKQAA